MRGYRRAWQVAMDNTRDLPGYKYYVDPETGERPAIYVTYVDLARAPGSSVRGVVFEADDLAALDDRERNYRRAKVEVEPYGAVWAYMGTPEARGRFEKGRRTGTAVVDRAYYESLRWAERPPVPIRELTRIDL